MQVTGAATLSNGMFRLLVEDGFAPATGQTFVVLHAGSVVGDFSQVDLPDEDWMIEVTSDEVIATYTGVSTHPLDFDANGVVDAFDLSQLLAQWGTCP